ncbi:phosphotransferase family protein [Micromonospora avicenniae]|uniref:phosphotransferase family protein n=1 Tax=Micromonospora avicenniae TaxID=1198245 RepID=UPI00344779E1
MKAVPRNVVVELVDQHGVPVGHLPAFTVREPWWQDVTEIVSNVRRKFDVDIAVLRLLRADRPVPPGGSVTYLAEQSGGLKSLSEGSCTSPADEPRRLQYARPGGPAKTVGWAREALRERGIALVNQQQFRTWSLSSIWRLTTTAGELWLKEVPHLLSFESLLSVRLGEELGALTPPVICSSATRIIFRHIEGVDCYYASPALRLRIAGAIHRIHTESRAFVAGLLADGLPDRRGYSSLAGLETLSALVPSVARNSRLLQDLALERVERAERDGTPAVLLHGDLHPGNVRHTGDGLVILDWSNAYLGHPAFDVIRLTEGLPADQESRVVEGWARLWRAQCSHSKISESVRLLRPVHFLMRAIVTATYLTAFERSEHKYHRDNLHSYVRRLFSSLGLGTYH